MSQRSNLLLTLAYNGTPFFGWQQTKEGPSIEGELKRALKILTKEKVDLFGASRTDAGVHASGQRVNFHTSFKSDWALLLKSLNALLPHEIRVVGIEQVPHTFHATLHNTGKEYHYWIAHGPAQFPHLRHKMWHRPGKLDLIKMRQGASFLIGTHDFKAFCNHKKNERYASTTCSISRIDIIEHPCQIVQIIIQSDRFLYKMARNIAGTLASVGKGKIVAQEIEHFLVKQDRTLIGPTAPAHGLTLYRVLGEFIKNENSSRSCN